MPTLAYLHADGTVTGFYGTPPLDAEEKTDERSAAWAEMEAKKPPGAVIVELEPDEKTLANREMRPYGLDERGQLISHPGRKRVGVQRSLAMLHERRAGIERAAAIEGGDWTVLLDQADQEIEAKRAELANLEERS